MVVRYPNMLRLSSKLFPPGRFLANALKAIERWEAPDGEVKAGDVGFNELTVILRKKGILIGENDVLGRHEEENGLVPASIEIIPELAVIRGGKEEVIRINAPDPAEIRELKHIAADIARRRLFPWIIALLVVVLGIGVYLTCTG